MEGVLLAASLAFALWPFLWKRLAHVSKLTRTSAYLAVVHRSFLQLREWGFCRHLFSCWWGTLLRKPMRLRCDSMQFITGRVMDASGHLIPAAMVVNRAQDGGGTICGPPGAVPHGGLPRNTIALGAIGSHIGACSAIVWETMGLGGTLAAAQGGSWRRRGRGSP